MKSIKWLVPVFAFAVNIGASAGASAQGCSLETITLECSQGNDAAKFAAFASPETGKLFAKPLDFINNFTKPANTETFRKSLEKNWRAVNRVELRQRRKMRRRQISAAQFEEFAKEYARARNNYQAGLTFYRTLVWHGKTGKIAPAS